MTKQTRKEQRTRNVTIIFTFLLGLIIIFTTLFSYEKDQTERFRQENTQLKEQMNQHEVESSIKEYSLCKKTTKWTADRDINITKINGSTINPPLHLANGSYISITELKECEYYSK